MRCSLFLVSLALTSSAWAQESTENAIVLSVESSDPQIDPAALRQQLAERVELPVVGLAGSDAPIALVVVSVPRTGDALVITTARGASQRHAIARTPNADWLGFGLATIIEAIKAELSELTPQRGNRYALMSWSGGLRPRRDPELLRPWPWEAGRPARVRPAVVGGEIGSALSTPRPARQHQRLD